MGGLGDGESLPLRPQFLFKSQVEGIFGKTNKFSPFGQVVTYGETLKFLRRRIKFANKVKEVLGDAAKNGGKDLDVGKSVVFIAGLPR